MDLGTLAQEVHDEMNKTSLSLDKIKRKAEQALRHIEMTNDWNYMRKISQFTLNPEQTFPRRIAQPALIKSIEFVRVLNSDGAWDWVYSADAASIATSLNSQPRRYYKDGFDYIWFDNTPDQIYTGELCFTQFTDWSDDDGFEPWMFKVAHPVIFFETVIALAPYLRESTLMQSYAPLAKRALDAALVMNEEYEYSDQRLYMEYA